jgi:uracil-DNA glycosylase
MSKQEQLDKLARDIIENKVCPELAASATRLVPGEGSVNAAILFVGEAPGATEDREGRPFCGASGKFLNEMLESINLNRDDVFITNIVKYRPPNNRDPKPDEIDAFRPYLQQQINIIKPQIIITLGRHAMNVFLPGATIGEIHGQPQLIEGQWYLPLYHPAAALFNGRMRVTLKEDFARIPDILENL